MTRFATQAATERLRLSQRLRVCDSPFRFVISLMTKMDREAATAAMASLRWGKHLIETFASQYKFASQMDCTVGTINQKNIDICISDI